MHGTRFGFSALLRLGLAAVLFLAGITAFAAPGAAATPAEQYISGNVQRGMAILNDKSLTKVQRRDKFQDFLTQLTDLKAIADYTLGQYRRGAAPADKTAYEEAYRDYALAVYRTYFDKFTGQSLKVTGSYKLDDTETVVKTVLVDATGSAGQKPLQVQFRVVTSGNAPRVIDICVSGVWLRQTQRDDFTSYLGQHGGDIKALVKILKVKTEQEIQNAK